MPEKIMMCQKDSYFIDTAIIVYTFDSHAMFIYNTIIIYEPNTMRFLLFTPYKDLFNVL